MAILDFLQSTGVGGLFYAAADTLLGGRLGLGRNKAKSAVDPYAIDLAGLRSSLVAAASEQLASQLASLNEMQQRLQSTPDDVEGLVSSLRAAVERTAFLVRSSQKEIIAVTSRITSELAPIQPELDRDPAGLAAQKWFPAASGHEPLRACELRTAPRFPFPHLQSIAPAGDDVAPEQAQFFDVQFRDISTSGFSFYLPQRLAADRLFARLGIEPETVLVQARVVHQTEVATSDGSTYRIGCQILRRIIEVQSQKEL